MIPNLFVVMITPWEPPILEHDALAYPTASRRVESDLAYLPPAPASSRSPADDLTNLLILSCSPASMWSSICQDSPRQRLVVDRGTAHAAVPAPSTAPPQPRDPNHRQARPAPGVGGGRIFVKPLPRFLPEPRFWAAMLAAVESPRGPATVCLGGHRERAFGFCSRHLWKTLFPGYMSRWNQYGSFFGDNFGWLASLTVYITVALTAMQVGLFSILGPLVAVGLVTVMFCYIFISNWVATRCYRKERWKLQTTIFQAPTASSFHGRTQEVSLRLSKPTELSCTLAGHVLLPSSRLARVVVRSGVQQSLEASTREVSVETYKMRTQPDITVQLAEIGQGRMWPLPAFDSAPRSIYL
ncbi:hypothetical protein VDGL01_12172 [Verticillium dahliae]